MRVLSKEEFILRATADLAERRKLARKKQDGIYRSYAKERHAAYIREKRNRGHGLKGAALQ